MSVFYQFFVDDIKPCCSKAITNAINSYFNLRQLTSNVTVDIIKHKLIVEIKDPKYRRSTDDSIAIRDIISKRGYNPQEVKTSPTFTHWSLGVIGLGLGLIVFLLCFFSAGLPFGVMLAIGIASSLLTVVLGWTSIRRAWAALRYDKKLTMDSLFVVSTTLVIVTSITSLFVPILPMMFEVGLLIYGFRHIGWGIEESLIKRFSEVPTCQSLVDPEVDMLVNGEWISTVLDKITIGSRIRIKAGQIIPLDVKVKSLQGGYIIDELQTGSKEPKKVVAESNYLAGVQLCINSPPLECEVIRAVADSNLAITDKSVRQALLEKEGKVAPIKAKADKIIKYFIPVIFLCAILSGILVGIFCSPALGLSCAVGVLVSACPCVLGLVIALALWAGVLKARRRGLVIMNGNAIEEASAITAIVLDFNGTLTKGMHEVTDTDWFVSENKYLALKIINTMEQRVINSPNMFLASLSIAHTFVRYLESLGIKEQLDEKTVVEARHGGLYIKYEGEDWYLGDRELIIENNINIAAQTQKFGTQRLFLAKGKQLQASFLLDNPLRDDAIETIRHLQQQVGSDNVYLCTGDRYHTKEEFAALLGIPCENIAVKQSHQDKLSLTQRLKEKGHRVATVGDGRNDIIMMADSDLGIVVLPTSDSLTRGHADIHITGTLLEPLQYLFPIAKQTFRVIYFNLMANLIYNLVSVLLAAGVLLTVGVILGPVVGAALMVLQVMLLFAVTYFVHKKSVVLKPLPIKPGGSYEHILQERLSELNNEICAPAKQVAINPYNKLMPEHSSQENDTSQQMQFSSTCPSF